MADVQGRPFLEYQLDQLRVNGIRDVVLCVGYLADLIRDYFGDGRRFGLSVDYSVESTPLGTAGAIRHAREFIEETFIVLNGDSYVDLNFTDLIEAHGRRQGKPGAGVGTVAVARQSDVSSGGSVRIDRSNRIVAFREKVGSGPGWVNAGVYVLEPSVLEWVPNAAAVSIEHEVFPRILRGAGVLYAYRVPGQFVDIGTPDSYGRFRVRAGKWGTAPVR